MAEAISIGSLTLDLFFSDSSLTIKRDRFTLALGGKYVVEDFRQGIGGGGGNVAVGLSRAGVKTALWAELGKGGVSKLIRERLAEEHVELSLLEEDDDFTNISAILLSPRGERTIVNHRSRATSLTFDDRKKTAIGSAKLLYLGNMPELSVGEKADIVGFARKKQVRTALNLGVKDCRLRYRKLSGLLSEVDYLIINRYELADIIDVPANELLLAEVNYFPKLGLPEGAVLVVTDGEFGSYAQTGKEIAHQIAYKVPRVVDATGAGDAFTSGFLAAVLHGNSLADSLRAGAKNSASVIQRINAQDGLLEREKLLS